MEAVLTEKGYYDIMTPTKGIKLDNPTPESLER
jgi:hypothetical protein